jgi:ABC-type dipeptide/oligopeptide/nickel transport system ATPase subunit
MKWISNSGTDLLSFWVIAVRSLGLVYGRSGSGKTTFLQASVDHTTLDGAFQR